MGKIASIWPSEPGQRRGADRRALRGGKRYKTFEAATGTAGGLIRVVLVAGPEPGGWVAFFCTDCERDRGAEILATVADQFSLEITFRDCKEIVGAGQQQVRFVWANIGAFNICLWTFTMTEALGFGLGEEDELVEPPGSHRGRTIRTRSSSRPTSVGPSVVNFWRTKFVGFCSGVTEDEIRVVAERLLSLAA